MAGLAGTVGRTVSPKILAALAEEHFEARNWRIGAKPDTIRLLATQFLALGGLRRTWEQRLGNSEYIVANRLARNAHLRDAVQQWAFCRRRAQEYARARRVTIA